MNAKLTKMAEMVARGLEIELNKPFRCEEGKDAWYKLTSNFDMLWDAGTDQAEWFNDDVVLMHLIDGRLTPIVEIDPVLVAIEDANEQMRVCMSEYSNFHRLQTSLNNIRKEYLNTLSTK